jgi:hypothetical protein
MIQMMGEENEYLRRFEKKKKKNLNGRFIRKSIFK